MSNRQFTLTIKACEILERVPKRSRSKFVSDALVNYAKKTAVFDEYETYESSKTDISKPKSTTTKRHSKPLEPNVNVKEDNPDNNQKKKVKIASGY